MHVWAATSSRKRLGRRGVRHSSRQRGRPAAPEAAWAVMRITGRWGSDEKTVVVSGCLGTNRFDASIERGVRAFNPAVNAPTPPQTRTPPRHVRRRDAQGLRSFFLLVGACESGRRWRRGRRWGGRLDGFPPPCETTSRRLAPPYRNNFCNSGGGRRKTLDAVSQIRTIGDRFIVPPELRQRSVVKDRQP
jgi:hypothetical protein